MKIVIFKTFLTFITKILYVFRCMKYHIKYCGDYMRGINKLSNIFETTNLGTTRIEIIDNKRLTVEGGYGLNEYNEEYIMINMPKGILTVFGLKLNITLMQDRVITIDGNIQSLEIGVGAL